MEIDGLTPKRMAERAWEYGLIERQPRTSHIPWGVFVFGLMAGFLARSLLGMG